VIDSAHDWSPRRPARRPWATLTGSSISPRLSASPPGTSSSAASSQSPVSSNACARLSRPIALALRSPARRSGSSALRETSAAAAGSVMATTLDRLSNASPTMSMRLLSSPRRAASRK
jgi:hypothetical protein